MSIENGGPDPANRPWARWAIIGATVVAALVGGYWVGTALFGSPQPAQVSIVTPAATLALRPTFTPTLPPTNTPVPTATSAAAAPATQPAECRRRAGCGCHRHPGATAASAASACDRDGHLCAAAHLDDCA